MNKRRKIVNNMLAIAGMFILVLMDQCTKLLAIEYLKNKQPMVLIEGVFELQYLENQGAAFGIMQNQVIFLLIMTIVAFLAIVYFYSVTPHTRHYLPIHLCMIFIMAGSIGNFIDRLIRGFVVDFFYFSFINFPIFNVADIYVTIAFFVLIFLVLFYYKEEELEIYSLNFQKGHEKL